MGPITPFEVGVFLFCLVMVLALDGWQDHRRKVYRRNSRHRTALRGFDPYEADFDWRKNR